MCIEKRVVSLCPVQKKKCFCTYKDALRFARKVSQQNKSRRKTLGNNYKRNLPKHRDDLSKIDKVVRSIYVCKYCGYYHFSSVIKKDIT